MPPRTALSSRALRSAQAEPYVCLSCLSKPTRTHRQRNVLSREPQQSRSYRTKHNSIQRQSQRASHIQPTQTRQYAANGSVASSTAVNAPSTVPLELRDLHQRLTLLQDKASSFVDLSRLSLALRSLESADPVIRVAFLGLGNNGVRAARKLAKVLLADELGDEAEWERALLQDNDGRSTLLRYGEPQQDTGVQPNTSPLIQELRIPSPRLKRWNAEILVTGLNANGLSSSDSAERARELEESILVPTLTIPAAGSRVGFVRNPVHKALIVADGVTGAVEYGRFPAALADGKLIAAALSLPLQAKSTKPSVDEDSRATPVSIELAEQALKLFRSSNANGAVYSEQWQESRVNTVSSWILAASQPSAEQNSLKPAVDDLITSILSRTDSNVARTENATAAASTALTIPEAKRIALQSAIASWSEEAHRDLQMNLSAALLSPQWRRTTWWRLFWRIDEVSLSAGAVLRRGWLVEAEQSLAFLSGRILEAGLASVQDLKREPAGSGQAVSAQGLLNEMLESEVNEYKATQSEGAAQKPNVAELMQLPPMIARVQEESGLNAMFDPPWPQTIHLARQQMLHQQVPSMHRKAQAFMLASLSTIGGSGALGAWLWVASGGIALYEAGAITALGLVWALRRLQKKWSKERADFTQAARDDARRVLGDVEGRLKRLVQEGGRAVVRDEDRREWQEARAAVKACQEAKTAIAQHEAK